MSDNELCSSFIPGTETRANACCDRCQWIRAMHPNKPITYDIGDEEACPEFASQVASLEFDDEYEEPIKFGRTYDGQWKTYIFGGKWYFTWPEVLRRFGPVTITAVRDDDVEATS